MADKVVIEARDDGEKMRADLFLSRELARILGAEISRERIKSMFQAACVFQNGLSLKPSSKVKPGEVEIRLPLRKLKEIATTKGNALSIEPVNIPLDVLYEDGELVVINKRAGMSVHPSPSDFDPTVAAALMHKYGVTISEADFERALTLRRGAPGADDGGEDGDDLAGGGDAPEPSYIDAIESLKSALLAKNIGIVHRLDKMTSGCLAVARSVHAYEFMAERFAAREVEKEYLAITAGTPPSETGLIDAPIIRNPQGRTKYTALAFGERRGRDASTEYCVAAAAYGLAVLRLKIHTGRTHQIRVHLKTIGLEILGDELYGTSANKEFLRYMRDGAARRAGKGWRELYEKLGAKKCMEIATTFGFSGELRAAGQMLHARRLAFPHPGGGSVRISAPLPPTFSFLASEIGFDEPE